MLKKDSLSPELVLAIKREIREKTSLSYSRSGGPGGQNVNKRDTKVTAKLKIAELETVGERGQERLAHYLAKRLSKNGNIVLQVSQERCQLMNREEIFKRLENLLFKALKPEPPARRLSRPSRAARKRRLEAKKIRSILKRESRQRPGLED